MLLLKVIKLQFKKRNALCCPFFFCFSAGASDNNWKSTTLTNVLSQIGSGKHVHAPSSRISAKTHWTILQP